MPPFIPEQVLACLSDSVTQVRDTTGRLLGCVPKVEGDTTLYVTSPTGQNFEIWTAAVAVVRCDPRTHDPRTLFGFVPVDECDAIIDEARAYEAEPGRDPDIGRGV